MPRVYVVQEDPKKNVLPAGDFGELVSPALFEHGEQIVLSAAAAVRRVRSAMAGFEEGDFVLAVGDPVAIGIACAVASKRTGGVFSVLKWDRQEHRYYPVKVDLESAL